MNTFYECSGCGVCALVCPTWTQNQDIALTPWGRAKALQGGATEADLKDSLDSCVNCGACTPMCPEKIDIHKEDQKLKNTLSIMPLKDDWYEDHYFLSEALLEHHTFSRVIKRLVKLKAKGNEMVSDYAPFHRRLIEMKSPHSLMGIAEWLTEKKLIQKQLKSGDLLWIDASLFHLRYETLVKKFDRLKKESGCDLNWNLQRTAMPLGQDNPFFKRKAQYEWVVFKKDFKRIIVENIEEWKWLKSNSDISVFHICEIIGDV